MCLFRGCYHYCDHCHCYHYHHGGSFHALRPFSSMFVKAFKICPDWIASMNVRLSLSPLDPRSSNATCICERRS